MIEGCEEIKAYVYEASRFQRVDLAMYDSNTYHSIYMQTPKMWNWTKTHGGPYYVEVGKNLSIQYMETVNVSVPIQNTGNDTNATVQYNYVVQNLEKTWVYYEYDPSNVEYYYYKDCIVKEMQPHSGLLNGGTLV